MATQSTSTENLARASRSAFESLHEEHAAALTARLVGEGADPDSVALVEAFGRFGPAYQRWAMAVARRDGVSLARMRVMWVLRARGPQRMSDLKDALGVTARNVTQLVDGLEAEGMVRRLPHPSDRRAVVVELTDRADDVLEDAFADHSRQLVPLFERLPAQDRADLRRIIETLTGHLDEVAGGDAVCRPAV